MSAVSTLRLPTAAHDDIGLQRHGLEVVGGAVADGDGGVVACSSIMAMGLPTMLLAANDHRRACRLQVRSRCFPASSCSRKGVQGQKPGLPDHQRAGAGHMEAVHVLGGRDGLDHLVRVDVRRQGQLHQDAVDAGVAVERIDAREQLGLAQWWPGIAPAPTCRPASSDRP